MSMSAPLRFKSVSDPNSVENRLPLRSKPGTYPPLPEFEDARPAMDREARVPSGDPGSPAQTEPPGSETANKSGEKSEPRSRKKLMLGGVGAIALLAASWFAYDYITVGRFLVSTDDAYVGADMALIAPKIAANVAEVPIVENQAVKEGDVLIRLDDGDYKLAVDQATAKLATQRAAIQTFDAQIRAAQAAETQSRAQLDAAQASVLKAEADYLRTKPLADRDFTSKATLDAAIAARDTARAQVKSGEAAIESAVANVALLGSQKQQAEQVAKELEVALAKAQRDLSFAVIRAPFNGVVGNRSVQVGDYVTPGKRLLAVVPLDHVFVDANVKETQLADIKVGDVAEVRVDALGGEAFKGVVESVAPASGSQFSLLPPENATGNFTKIVQRVPVRIVVNAPEADGKLRPGLSVVVSIDTRTASKSGTQQAAARTE
ncbi:HlyD family secretion protein [Hyphomicrobium sp. LHD-15]|uniref:HlyD family secretion protein n=1 Tax=Hyphomicrobium sp. LHD-15 TaxID=3072142 RepID=UPI00280CF009|nr:HlyD family secretion protein [Hyphomicrobium sp. LHD-15]MDQ8698942.1 HlyD family secretion protein [Hyphomicrobium sp. LHD-15]